MKSTYDLGAFIMVNYKCDGCGKLLEKNELRYKVKIEVIAIYEKNEVHLKDLIQNHQEEIVKLIKQMEDMSVDELESQIYKNFEFDLCPSCHKRYISNPKAGLNFAPIEKDSSYNLLCDFLRKINNANN